MTNEFWFQETDLLTRMSVQKYWIELISQGRLKVPVEQTIHSEISKTH